MSTTLYPCMAWKASHDFHFPEDVLLPKTIIPMLSFLMNQTADATWGWLCISLHIFSFSTSFIFSTRWWECSWNGRRKELGHILMDCRTQTLLYTSPEMYGSVRGLFFVRIQFIEAKSEACVVWIRPCQAEIKMKVISFNKDRTLCQIFFTFQFKFLWFVVNECHQNL